MPVMMAGLLLVFITLTAWPFVIVSEPVPELRPRRRTAIRRPGLG